MRFLGQFCPLKMVHEFLQAFLQAFLRAAPKWGMHFYRHTGDIACAMNKNASTPRKRAPGARHM